MIAALARASSPVVSPDYLIWTRYWRLGKQQDRTADDRHAGPRLEVGARGSSLATRPVGDNPDTGGELSPTLSDSYSRGLGRQRAISSPRRHSRRAMGGVIVAEALPDARFGLDAKSVPLSLCRLCATIVPRARLAPDKPRPAPLAPQSDPRPRAAYAKAPALSRSRFCYFPQRRRRPY